MFPLFSTYVNYNVTILFFRSMWGEIVLRMFHVFYKKKFVCKTFHMFTIITYIKRRRDEKWSRPWTRLSRHPSPSSLCPSVWLSARILKDNGKEKNQELHTIPLLSLTLQFSAHQEWEGNKPGMAFHPCPYLDTSSSSMCCLLAGRCINNHHVWWIIFTHDHM